MSEVILWYGSDDGQFWVEMPQVAAVRFNHARGTANGRLYIQLRRNGDGRMEDVSDWAKEHVRVGEHVMSYAELTRPVD